MTYLQIVILLTLGFGIGAFGTLIGVGGGFLAVPLLIIFYGLEPRFAVGTSLFFVFFNTLSGSIAYLRQRRVDLKVGLMFIALATPGSILGAYMTSYFESNVFKLTFSALLIATSTYLIAKPSMKQHNSLKDEGYHRKLVDYKGNVYEYYVKLGRGLMLSFFIGFISSIFGIGGGVLHMPAMIFLLGFPIHISTATSHFILVFNSLAGSATHASLGNVNFIFAIPMSIGAILGAQFGALISHKLKGTTIEKLLSIALIIVAIRLVMQAF
ncbi:MAG: sulfite exporter TauE/SafE family protein [Candidatus Bathyarchaeota archaeon]